MQTRNALLFSSITAFLALTADALPAAENLEDGMRESGWDRILGTWVDEGTNGKGMKGVAVEDRVLECAAVMALWMGFGTKRRPGPP